MALSIPTPWCTLHSLCKRLALNVGKTCDCDGISLLGLCYETLVKGFCRHNYGPSSGDFEFIKEIILSMSDGIRYVFKRHLEDRDTLLLALQRQTDMSFTVERK